MLVSGSRNEDLISGEVAGSGVMSTVRDSPAVVRDADGRVKNPSDSIVDGLGERKRTAEGKLVRREDGADQSERQELTREGENAWCPHS
jgi:hypothetical protein